MSIKVKLLLLHLPLTPLHFILSTTQGSHHVIFVIKHYELFPHSVNAI
jgi:hypothetical protein